MNTEPLKRALDSFAADLEAGRSVWIPASTLRAASAAIAQAEADKQAEPVTKRQLDTAMSQWEHWKQYALELQQRLVKYEGGSQMVLNAQSAPQAVAQGYKLVPVQVLQSLADSSSDETARGFAKGLLSAAPSTPQVQPLLFSRRKAIANRLGVPMDMSFNAIVRETEIELARQLGACGIGQPIGKGDA